MTEPKSSETTETTDDASNVVELSAEKPSLIQRIVAEVKGRPFAYSVLGVSLVAGPIIATMIFPQAPPGAAATGGLLFGVYAALCAVPQKFM
ncbi:MAG: hypothetical protein AB8G23_09250 [Myxococcota bacterium]